MSTGGGRRKRHHEEEHENHERWLVTYADMLTVLMALFIVMFALSVVDKKKFEEFSNGLNDKPGAGSSMLDGGDGLLAVQSSTMTMDVEAAAEALAEKQARQAGSAQEIQDLESARDRILQELQARGMQESVKFQIDERGLVVTVVTDEVLFDLGSATLRPGGTAVLDAIAPALTAMPNPVTVEGHTDDLPISGGRFPSNWELSTERATSVLRYMLERHALPAGRLSAAGYADQRPLSDNASPAGRSTNRRVEVIVRAVAAAPASAPLGIPAAPAAAAGAAPGADPASAPTQQVTAGRAAPAAGPQDEEHD